MPNKIVMKNGRNATKTKKASSKSTKSRSRNGAVTVSPTALAAAKKLIAQRNGAKIVKANPKGMSKRKKGGKRKNGAGGFLETMRNGIFGQQSILGVGKTVALGSVGALSAGVIGRSVMSLGGNRIAGMGVQPFVVQSVIEALASVTVIQMVANKVFSGNTDNAATVMTGGLIKAGLTLINGLLPDVSTYNPFAQAAMPQNNADMETVAGLYDEHAQPQSGGVMMDAGIAGIDDFDL